MGFQIPLAENGAGIAMLPALAVDKSLRAGHLERVLPEYARKDASLYLVSRAPRHMPKRVVLLRDFLFEQLTRDLARRSE
jgi:DNA-binding transcriptional LysR family regulator